MDKIDRIDPDTISYVDFFCDYLLANKPCIITSNVTQEWPARNDWIKEDGLPNMEFLISRFGEAQVPVIETKQFSGYDSQTQSSMKFSDFLSAQFNSQDNSLYLKDWHFVKEFPSYEAYKVPIYFRNDWMNEYWDNKNDSVEVDYRFVYMGGENTWTPFHADVFRSHSWSANICGDKEWILVRPGVEQKLEEHWKKDKPHFGSLANMNDIRAILQNQPELLDGGGVSKIIQKPGEIIFVPSNWHHQVQNLNSVISINHNWCNGANIDLIWRYLCDRLEAVKKELADCRSLIDAPDWFQQCQTILKCDIGMDFHELLSLLNLIIETRLKRLQSRPRNKLQEKSLFHCNFCSCEFFACKKTSACLHDLKACLKAHCTCSSGNLNGLSQCDFCFSFFDTFDIKAGLYCMKSVLSTEDAKMLPLEFVPIWEKRVVEVEIDLDACLE